MSGPIKSSSKLLKVKKSTSSKKGGVVVTLIAEAGRQVQTPFGVQTVNSTSTYYMKLEVAPAVGMEAEIDLADYHLFESKPFLTDSGATITPKWLIAK